MGLSLLAVLVLCDVFCSRSNCRDEGGPSEVAHVAVCGQRHVQFVTGITNEVAGGRHM